jgi:hypothetical protein
LSSSRPGSAARVRFGGEVLIEDTWNPEFEGCHAIVARGFTGPFEVWRTGKAHPDMFIPDIEEGARWTVVENDKEGPAIKRWEPFPERVQPDAVASGRVLAPAAEINRG